MAAILEAAEAVIAEKGYESATMAEIAARSSTQIGLLYRFFPNKESLADAIVVNALENLKAMFDQFDADAKALSIEPLADGLLALFIRIFSRRALRKLIASGDRSIKQEEFRKTALQRTARTLTSHSAKLPEKSAADIAAVLLSHAKTMATYEETFGSAPSVMIEFCDMIRLYLQSRLGSATWDVRPERGSKPLRGARS